MHFARITLFLRNCLNGDGKGFEGLKDALLQLLLLVA